MMDNPMAELVALAALNLTETMALVSSRKSPVSVGTLQCPNALASFLPRMQAHHVACVLSAYCDQARLVPRRFMLALLTDPRSEMQRYGLRVVGLTDQIDENIVEASTMVFEKLIDNDKREACAEFSRTLRTVMRRDGC